MEKSKDTDGPPNDKKFLISTLFYAFGVVSVVPANFFTTATDFWLYKFRDVESNISYNSDNRTSLQTEFTANYTIVANVANLAFIIITIRYIRNYVGLSYRILGGLCGVILIFMITSISVEVDTDSWQRGFFGFTLTLGFFLSAFSGMFIVSVFELAGKFSELDLAPLFSGQAVCGILAALVQIFALGVGGEPTTTGIIYFLIGMFFVFLTMSGFLYGWKKSEFFEYHLMKTTERKKTNLKVSKEVALSALKKAGFYMGSMVLALGCTIMIHPGVTSLVVSIDKGSGNTWNEKFFGPTVSYLFYYLFDYVGRELGMFIKKPSSGFILFILSCCRIPLVPLIIFCNAQPREHLPVVINSDAAYAIFVILFAFSGGYLVNLAIITVPRITSEEEKPVAMLLIFLVMVVSLALCSATSSALVKAL